MNREDLLALVSLVDSPTTVDDLQGDEHARYDLYVSALALTDLGEDAEVIQTILSDPDRTMREAVLGEHVDRMAARLQAYIAFGEWYEERKSLLSGTAFPRRRADEWLVYKRVLEGLPVPIDEYLNASNWLQVNLSIHADAQDVLSALSEGGRTRRVRARARARLAEGT